MLWPRSTGAGGPNEEVAEKIADRMYSLKLERSGVDGTDPRGGKSTSSLI